MTDEGRRVLDRRHALFRFASFATAFALSAACVMHGAQRAVDAAKIEQAGLSLNLAGNLEAWKQRLARDHAPERVALIGDSNMMIAAGMTAPGRETLPRRISAALRQRGEVGRRIRLNTLCTPGLGPSGIYFISDELVRAHPDRIVLSLNLGGLNRDSLREFAYVEMAGWLGAGRLWQAAWLPLLDLGLTFDRVLLYKGVVAFGAVDRWYQTRQLQARAFKLREWAAAALEQKLGVSANADMQFALGIARLERSEVPGRNRRSRLIAQRVFGPLLSGLSRDEPSLQLLGAALQRFHDARIPTLVYLPPINVQHLRSLGLHTEKLDASLEPVRRTILEHGAQLADFHALLPDAAFRDAGDHYTFEGAPNGTNWLGDRIAKAIVDTDPSVSATQAGRAVQ